MTFVRLIVADLVEKRLWPVAAVLAGAVVAAPVAVQMTAVHGGVRQKAHPAQSARSTAVSPALRGMIGSASGDQPTPATGAQLHDPFAGPSAVAGGAAATATSAARAHATGPSGSRTSSAVGSGSAAGLRSTGGSTSAGVSASKPGLGSATTNASNAPRANTTPSRGARGRPTVSPHAVPARLGPRGVYRVSLSFGQAGSLRTRRNPRRLTLLGSAHGPAVIFLGVLKGGRKAVFWLPPEARPTGDGTSVRCAASGCNLLFLSPGDSEFLDIRSAAGPLVQYELDLTSIAVGHMRSARQAAAARRREDRQGHALLHQQTPMLLTEATSGNAKPGTAISKLGYSPKLGALVPLRAPVRRAGASSAGTSAAPDTPLAPAAPGLPAPPARVQNRN